MAAAVILLALVRPWGRLVPRRLVRGVAWLGAAVMTAVGIVGVITTLGAMAGLLGADDAGLYPGTFLFVYGCFLILGVAFGVTARLTSDSSVGPER